MLAQRLKVVCVTDAVLTVDVQGGALGLSGARRAGDAVLANCAAALQASPLPPTCGFEESMVRCYRVGGLEALGIQAEAPCHPLSMKHAEVSKVHDI